MCQGRGRESTEGAGVNLWSPGDPDLAQPAGMGAGWGCHEGCGKIECGVIFIGQGSVGTSFYGGRHDQHAGRAGPSLTKVGCKRF